jgi:hypothetical protein
MPGLTEGYGSESVSSKNCREGGELVVFSLPNTSLETGHAFYSAAFTVHTATCGVW